MPNLPNNNASPNAKAGLAIPRKLAWALAVTCLVAALGAWALAPQKPQERRTLGLMTTLPIYWGEVDGINEMIAGTAQPHWARTALEQDFELIPLDSLAGPDSVGKNARIDHVLLAQPRALSGPENVALDNFVRRGGRVLLFADPMLTSHSRFSIGDRRRPQDVVLLSPILTRWGLELQFDDAQDAGERIVQFGGIALPVDLPGKFRAAARTQDVAADCEIGAGGLVADCAVGQGRALIIADAAILDQDAGSSMRENALLALTERAFSER